MTLVSYAQNYEDIMLWRAFHEVEKGFFIDVGANAPIGDSVTYLFYEHGWRGINIEPIVQWFELLQELRPEDINLQAAIVHDKDQLVVHNIPNTGLATTDVTVARRHQQMGYQVSTVTVPAYTLNAICAKYAQDQTIHFLKVDVEGAEESVLRSIDLERYRPIVILVEATLPNSKELSYFVWEHLITDKSYDFVYFDGLNRFYLAQEYAHLRQAFATPPNVLDDFMQYREVMHRKTIINLQTKLKECQQDIQQLQEKAEQCINELQALKTGTIWRTTHPLRLSADFFKVWWRQRQQSRQLVMPERRRTLFYDVSIFIWKDYATGVHRATRRILEELVKVLSADFDIELIYAQQGQYYYADSLKQTLLGINDVPIRETETVSFHAGDKFLHVDLGLHIAVEMGDVLLQLKQQGVAIYYVVHDLLAIQLPAHYFEAGVLTFFPRWLEVISHVAHGLLCTTYTGMAELLTWLQEHQYVEGNLPRIGVCRLGADIPCMSRAAQFDIASFSWLSQRPSLLMVGTLEPRKGYWQTLQAFETLWAQGIDIQLVIVGRQGWHVDDLLIALQQHPEYGKRLYWLNFVEDAVLAMLYQSCSALLMASEGEGFGLPLIEAAHYNLPLIIRDLPVFREIIGDNAYYFSGRESADLSKAIVSWLSLYQQQEHPLPTAVNWGTWAESAACIKSFLLQ